MTDKERTENLIKWLHADSEADEDEARRLLADLLRTTHPLDLGLRFALGDLFDPDLKQEQGCYFAIKRVRGNRKKRLPFHSIAAHVWRAVQSGDWVKKAVPDAAKEFACDERTVREAWSMYKPVFQKYPEMGWGDLPPKDWPK